MSLIYKNKKYSWVTDEPVPNITYTVADYDYIVSEKIRERYSIDEELAIQRQRDTKIDEFNEYYNYCEACKVQARQLCNIN